MFDYFKLSLPPQYINQLFRHKDLDFTQVVYCETAEPSVTFGGFIKHRAVFQEFEIIVWTHPTGKTKQRFNIEINGSFHKMWQDGSNFRDFLFYEFCTAASQFCDLIGLAPDQLVVHGFEIGVNITCPIDITTFIEGLKTMSGTKFERDTFGRNGLLFRFVFSEYLFKIYDKGSQFGRDFPILRVELKVLKMAYLRNKGVNITSLQDLISGYWNQLLADLLKNQFDKIIMWPEGMVNPEQIANPRSRKNFILGGNPDYWTNLPSKLYNKRFNAFKKEFRRLSAIDLYTLIPKLIADKLHTLITQPQRGKYYPYVNGNIATNPLNQGTRYKFCLSCGRDISHQHPKSKFCSDKTTNPKEAHKCRNLDSNPRNNQKAKVKRRLRRENRLYPGLTLFPALVHMGVLEQSSQNVSLTGLTPIIYPRFTNHYKLNDFRPIHCKYKPTIQIG